MTTESSIVFGLVALLIVCGALLWRLERVRGNRTQDAKRAQRLQEQIAWDKVMDDVARRP